MATTTATIVGREDLLHHGTEQGLALHKRMCCSLPLIRASIMLFDFCVIDFLLLGCFMTKQWKHDVGHFSTLRFDFAWIVEKWGRGETLILLCQSNVRARQKRAQREVKPPRKFQRWTEGERRRWVKSTFSKMNYISNILKESVLVPTILTPSPVPTNGPIICILAQQEFPSSTFESSFT